MTDLLTESRNEMPYLSKIDMARRLFARTCELLTRCQEYESGDPEIRDRAKLQYGKLVSRLTEQDFFDAVEISLAVEKIWKDLDTGLDSYYASQEQIGGRCLTTRDIIRYYQGNYTVTGVSSVTVLMHAKRLKSRLDAQSDPSPWSWENLAIAIERYQN